jgi:hypothetical protein
MLKNSKLKQYWQIRYLVEPLWLANGTSKARKTLGTEMLENEKEQVRNIIQY